MSANQNNKDEKKSFLSMIWESMTQTQPGGC